MLKVTDLTVSKELSGSEMASVTGGSDELERLSALVDFSTAIDSKVAAVQQGFGLNLGQSNVGAVTNNQAIYGGNGVVYAPVTQTQTQANYMDLLGLGNTAVS